MYQIVQQGYQGGEPFKTRREARAALREAQVEEADRCRQRFGKATVLAHSPDCKEIVIGNRQSVSRWTVLSIREVS